MPCMCGDPYCGSCGPAQGYFKCSACGRWSQDGPCDDPAKCAEEITAMDQQAAQYEKEAAEYWAARPEEQ